MPEEAILVSATLTVKQVADILRLSEKSVYRAVYDGKLTAYKFGRSLRFKPADVERALKPVHATEAGDAA